MVKLTETELNEDLNITWGRIRGIVKYLPGIDLSKIDRLKLLINKFDEDLKHVDLRKTINICIQKMY